MNRFKSPFSATILAVAVALLIACENAGDEDPFSDGGADMNRESGASGSGAGSSAAGDSSATAGSPGVVEAGGAGPTLVSCDPPDHKTPASLLSLTSVRARLVDPERSPLPDMPALICGKDVCSLATTDGSGWIDKTYSPPIEGDSLALKTGDGINFAEFVLPITESATELGDQVVFQFPDASNGAALAAGTTVESNGVSLVAVDGASVEIDPIVYSDPTNRNFRAVVIAPADFPGAVDGDLGLGLVVSAAPVEARICPPAQLTVPNLAGWEPNANVEVVLHGVSISEAFAPYGGWAELTNAVVDADGETVTTTGGVPVLGTLGFRLSDS